MATGRTRGPDRARVKILTVNPETRRIDAGLRDGGIIQVSVISAGPVFTWPKEGENWNVARVSNTWVLDSVIEDTGPDVTSISDLQPGEAQIKADTVYDGQGNQFLTAGGAGSGTTFYSLIGDGVENEYTIAHPFSTRRVAVEVVRNSTPWDTVTTTVRRPDNDHVFVGFINPIATNSYYVLVTP